MDFGPHPNEFDTCALSTIISAIDQTRCHCRASGSDEKLCFVFARGTWYLCDWYLLFTYRQHHNQLSLRLMLTVHLLQRVFRLSLAFWIGHDN